MSIIIEKGEIVYTTKGSKVFTSNDDGLPQSSHVNSFIKDSIVIEKPLDNSISPLKRHQKSLLKINSITKSPPKESYRKTKRKKKSVTFKEPFEDILEIQSFKSYNELMTYTDYYTAQDEPLKKEGICNTIKLCAKKLCIIF